jgi:hypothetical protein
MQQLLRDRRLSIAAPIALIGVVLIAFFRLDCTTSGGAEPPPLLGAVGSPVRPTYIPPTSTPEGFAPTPRPRPTAQGLTGTEEERDNERREHALIILNALQQLRQQDGEYPSTGGNLQSLCVFSEVDAGCKLRDVLGAEPPNDPRGRSSTSGYWYLSDGATATLYIAFEAPIPAEEVCPDPHPGFAELDLPYLICPTLT